MCFEYFPGNRVTRPSPQLALRKRHLSEPVTRRLWLSPDVLTSEEVVALKPTRGHISKLDFRPNQFCRFPRRKPFAAEAVSRFLGRLETEVSELAVPDCSSVLLSLVIQLRSSRSSANLPKLIGLVAVALEVSLRS